MPDGRANNGGNSTKAKGVDKRKNEYREALREAVSMDDFKAVIEKLVEKAKDGDVRATQELLNRVLGKPDQSIDVTSEGAGIVVPELIWRQPKDK